MVHSCYSIETYHEAYGYNINPLRGRAFWDKVNGVHVLPPLYTKIMGRPKRNRKKAPEEKQKNGATYITKAGLTMHCSICGKANHNKKGHYKYIESVQLDEQELVQAAEEAEVDDPTILQVYAHFGAPFDDRCISCKMKQLLFFMYSAAYHFTEYRPKI
jgi:hypothetical protein